MQSQPPGSHDCLTLPTGWFTLDVVRDGRVIERMDEANLVVVGAQTILAGMIGGGRPAPGISLISFGTNMAPAVFGNTAITGAYNRPFENVAYLPYGVVFSFALPAGEANGLSIGEFGLLAPDGTLFARKSRRFAPLLKDANLSLSGTWTVKF